MWEIKAREGEKGIPSETKRGQKDRWWVWEVKAIVTEEGGHTGWRSRIGSQTPSRGEGCRHKGGSGGKDQRLVTYRMSNQTCKYIRVIGTKFFTLGEGSYKYGKEENLNSIRI